jgi:predicted nucleic acid-binding protein
VIAVDTSVWIDFLGGADSAQAERLVALIDSGAPVALTDVVLAELLQGVASDEEARLLERHLEPFPVLRLQELADFALAAALYRRARAAGVTVRKTLDCLIAAPCVREGVPLLHRDADFDRLASCTELEVVAV